MLELGNKLTNSSCDQGSFPQKNVMTLWTEQKSVLFTLCPAEGFFLHTGHDYSMHFMYLFNISVKLYSCFEFSFLFSNKNQTDYVNWYSVIIIIIVVKLENVVPFCFNKLFSAHEIQKCNAILRNINFFLD